MTHQEAPRVIREEKLKLVLELLDKNIVSDDAADNLAELLVEHDFVDEFSMADFDAMYTEARRCRNMLLNVSRLLDALAGNPESIPFIRNYVDELKNGN